MTQQAADQEQNKKKVTLWTRQHIKSLDELKTNGLIRINRKHLEEKFDVMADYMIKLYLWFAETAGKRVPKPQEVKFPIWCAISEKSMLKPTEDSVVYVLEVDESKVIYFDGTKWDYVLNHLYVPKDAEDEAAYRKEMENKGHKNLRALLDEKTAHFYPREIKQVMDSWVRIFEIEEWNIFRVQANIWEIRPDMVREILYSQESGTN
ncbi:hypothetical protein DCMF_12725 [Candidatus Formimonas warabiya]|uniref:DUF3841 domain-containing protein n=2 Tax=Formimonas warabiya TaxID=1761012 RepID=A0A3G1L1C3_FORW1|nr:hypothetical protein DCMF_12725 [Candidatus Formimonas warabiya]